MLVRFLAVTSGGRATNTLLDFPVSGGTGHQQPARFSCLTRYRPPTACQVFLSRAVQATNSLLGFPVSGGTGHQQPVRFSCLGRYRRPTAC
ncbi:hypothetical protein RRG08_021396 [Elysia crispata]|uniref:Uncharacterized protein n=1 Tax=Elysia crispata TaxID=231223 RepID=A0AAE1DAN6_9GAST|nr:hypothetical protein RRG08_021396 [Elysia crispata]